MAPTLDWQGIAGKLAALLPPERFHAAALAYLKGGDVSRGGVVAPDGGGSSAKNTPARWAVALSGGADSLALLLLVWAHFPKGRRRLVALHFDHRLRGRASAADARFCASVCTALGVRCVTGRWEDRPAEVSRVSEASARTARLAFFDREMRRVRVSTLLLGHQLDDVAESLLMRLARGSGTAGLAAPRPVQRVADAPARVRPLLALSKDTLVVALREAGARWREDATNAAPVYTRNRMRSRVLPAWQRAVGGRDALAGAGLSRDRLDEDDAALEAWVDRTCALPGDGTLRLRRLRSTPRAVVRRALQRWLLEVAPGHTLSRQAVEDLLGAIEAGGDTRRSLGRDSLALIRRGKLICAPAPPPSGKSRGAR